MRSRSLGSRSSGSQGRGSAALTLRTDIRQGAAFPAALAAAGLGAAFFATFVDATARPSPFGWNQGALFLLGGAAFVFAALLLAGIRPRVGDLGLAFVAAFAVGLAVRAVLLPYDITNADVFLRWGTGVYDTGLGEAWQGGIRELVFFPVEYQILGSNVGLSKLLGIDPVHGLKAVGLVVDTGVFLLVLLFCRQWGLSPWASMLYWLNPYFAAMCWQGFVDSHVGLFALLCLLMVTARDTTSRYPLPISRYLLAGIPLGIALLLKPQAMAPAVMIVLFLVVYRARGGRTYTKPLLHLLAGAGSVFVVYCGYFLLAGTGPLRIAEVYYSFGDLVGPLSYMPNVWYLVAEAYRSGSELAVEVQGPSFWFDIAKVLLGAALVVMAWLIAVNADRRPLPVNLLLLFAAGTSLVPMLGTNTRENHLYLGGLFLLLLAMLVRDRTLRVAVGALLFVHFLNLFGRYGFGLDHDDGPRHPYLGFYTHTAEALAAAGATLAFAVVLYRFVRLVRTTELEERWAGRPIGAWGRATRAVA